jgi:signal transduction histidine kinase
MTVRARRRTVRPALRLRFPRHTIRLRLTALYGSLFLGSGIVLLAITFLLVHSLLVDHLFNTGPSPSTPRDAPIHTTAVQTADLQQVLIPTAIALIFMAVVSVALGWVVAGRALRPLRIMTAAARQMSDRNLDERLAIAGPDDEIKDLGDTIDGLLARLEGAFNAQRRFVANASHELRTPLTLTRAMLQVALADPALTLDSLRSTCQDVLDTGREQELLLEALLTLARSQRGLDHSARVDLAAITAEVLRSFRDSAAARGVSIDSEVGPAAVSGDALLLERTVSNLVENALRYNVRGGRVTVRTGTAAGRVALTVTNSGPQVPADQIARLLQPFQRLDAERLSQHDGLGLGLGLSIVAAIASAHDASLTAQPGPAGGLAIQISFPAP